ncbi:MAG: threonylcarbamoyl-AMP synthase [Christensenellaceae bacterium]|nr:threonylcarbamoyl-AMP synthase [Christensenellaceae bacterium]
MQTKVYSLFEEYEEGLTAAAKVIAEGGLCVFPTETVYGLGADALNEQAVKSIFTAKGRPQDNPLIVHICDISQADIAACDLSDMARKLLKRFWPGPFTAVLKKNSIIPDAVSAGLDTVGIRLPSSEYARELIKRSGCMIAAPSANLSGKPSPTKAAHVIEDMMGRVDVILDGGEADYGVESTVCDLTGEVPVILRPGGVTLEMIEEEVGCVKVANAVLNDLKEGEKAASPGMKYKHYSPRANVTVIESEDHAVLAKELMLRYDKYVSAGRKTLILCTEDTYKLVCKTDVKCIGKTVREVAHRIFDELRQADLDGFDEVLFEATDISGMGLAVMNRMVRAAGFDVIKL